MKRNKSIRILAFLLTLVMLFTSVPAVCLEALANTGSGQISVSTGTKYGLGHAGLYGPKKLNKATNNIVPYYNRNHVEYKGGSSLTVAAGWYDMLKKYINTTAGGSRSPVASDVPVYRLSRANGDTNSDSKTYAVTYVTFNGNSPATLINNAKKQGINLTPVQARMIYYVLNNGLKQFKNNSYAESLYFIATQAIIWEIQEGKRTGWGNTTGYVSTGNKFENINYDYRSNAEAKANARGALYNAYNKNLSGGYKYYWHDYFYTVYNLSYGGAKSGYKDYYDYILKACARDDGSSNTVTIDNKSYPIKEPGESYRKEMVWNASANNGNGRYEVTYTIDPNIIGTEIGMYDTGDIVLPMCDFVKDGYGSALYVKLKSGSTAFYRNSNKEYGSWGSYNRDSVYGKVGDKNQYVLLFGRTNSTSNTAPYYAMFYDKKGTQYWGYIAADRIDWAEWRSRHGVTDPKRIQGPYLGVNVNGSKLTFYSTWGGLERNSSIIWHNIGVTSSYYNSPTYFTGDEGTRLRGYVCGGMGGNHTYIKFLTAQYSRNAKFYCVGPNGTSTEYLGNYFVRSSKGKLPSNAYTDYKTKHPPTHNKTIVIDGKTYVQKKYEFSIWKQGKPGVIPGDDVNWISPAEATLSRNTAFYMYLKGTDYKSNADFYCSLCGEKINDTITDYIGTSKSLPTDKEHHCQGTINYNGSPIDMSKYDLKFKGWVLNPTIGSYETGSNNGTGTLNDAIKGNSKYNAGASYRLPLSANTTSNYYAVYDLEQTTFSTYNVVYKCPLKGCDGGITKSVREGSTYTAPTVEDFKEHLKSCKGDVGGHSPSEFVDSDLIGLKYFQPTNPGINGFTKANTAKNSHAPGSTRSVVGNETYYAVYFLKTTANIQCSLCGENVKSFVDYADSTIASKLTSSAYYNNYQACQEALNNHVCQGDINLNGVSVDGSKINKSFDKITYKNSSGNVVVPVNFSTPFATVFDFPVRTYKGEYNLKTDVLVTGRLKNLEALQNDIQKYEAEYGSSAPDETYANSTYATLAEGTEGADMAKKEAYEKMKTAQSQIAKWENNGINKWAPYDQCHEENVFSNNEIKNYEKTFYQTMTVAMNGDTHKFGVSVDDKSQYKISDFTVYIYNVGDDISDAEPISIETFTPNNYAEAYNYAKNVNLNPATFAHIVVNFVEKPEEFKIRIHQILMSTEKEPVVDSYQRNTLYRTFEEVYNVSDNPEYPGLQSWEEKYLIYDGIWFSEWVGFWICDNMTISTDYEEQLVSINSDVELSSIFERHENIDVYLYYTTGESGSSGISFALTGLDEQAINGISKDSGNYTLSVYRSETQSSLPTDYSSFMETASLEGSDIEFVKDVSLDECEVEDTEKDKCGCSNDYFSATYGLDKDFLKYCETCNLYYKVGWGFDYIEGYTEDDNDFDHRYGYGYTLNEDTGLFEQVILKEKPTHEPNYSKGCWMHEYSDGEETIYASEAAFKENKNLYNKGWQCVCGNYNNTANDGGVCERLFYGYTLFVVPDESLGFDASSDKRYYYYFVIKNNNPDEFEYTPEVTGGLTKYFGEKLYYDAKCASKEKENLIQINDVSKDGTTRPVSNADVLIMSKEVFDKYSDSGNYTWTCTNPINEVPEPEFDIWGVQINENVEPIPCTTVNSYLSAVCSSCGGPCPGYQKDGYTIATTNSEGWVTIPGGQGEDYYYMILPSSDLTVGEEHYKLSNYYKQDIHYYTKENYRKENGTPSSSILSQPCVTSLNEFKLYSNNCIGKHYATVINLYNNKECIGLNIHSYLTEANTNFNINMDNPFDVGIKEIYDFNKIELCVYYDKNSDGKASEDEPLESQTLQKSDFIKHIGVGRNKRTDCYFTYIYKPAKTGRYMFEFLFYDTEGKLNKCVYNVVYPDLGNKSPYNGYNYQGAQPYVLSPAQQEVSYSGVYKELNYYIVTGVMTKNVITLNNPGLEKITRSGPDIFKDLNIKFNTYTKSGTEFKLKDTIPISSLTYADKTNFLQAFNSTETYNLSDSRLNNITLDKSTRAIAGKTIAYYSEQSKQYYFIGIYYNNYNYIAGKDYVSQYINPMNGNFGPFEKQIPKSEFGQNGHKDEYKLRQYKLVISSYYPEDTYCDVNTTDLLVDFNDNYKTKFANQVKNVTGTSYPSGTTFDDILNNETAANDDFDSVAQALPNASAYMPIKSATALSIFLNAQVPLTLNGFVVNDEGLPVVDKATSSEENDNIKTGILFKDVQISAQGDSSVNIANCLTADDLKAWSTFAYKNGYNQFALEYYPTKNTSALTVWNSRYNSYLYDRYKHLKSQYTAAPSQFTYNGSVYNGEYIAFAPNNMSATSFEAMLKNITLNHKYSDGSGFIVIKFKSSDTVVVTHTVYATEMASCINRNYSKANPFSRSDFGFSFGPTSNTNKTVYWMNSFHSYTTIGNLNIPNEISNGMNIHNITYKTSANSGTNGLYPKAQYPYQITIKYKMAIPNNVKKVDLESCVTLGNKRPLQDYEIEGYSNLDMTTKNLFTLTPKNSVIKGGTISNGTGIDLVSVLDAKTVNINISLTGTAENKYLSWGDFEFEQIDDYHISGKLPSFYYGPLYGTTEKTYTDYPHCLGYASAKPGSSYTVFLNGEEIKTPSFDKNKDMFDFEPKNSMFWFDPDADDYGSYSYDYGGVDNEQFAVIAGLSLTEDIDIEIVADKTYSVKTGITNGTITPSNERINPSTNPTFTVTFKPNDGYTVSKVVVDGKEIELKNYEGGGSIVFKDKQDHTVDVTCSFVGLTMTMYLHKDAVDTNTKGNPLYMRGPSDEMLWYRFYWNINNVDKGNNYYDVWKTNGILKNTNNEGYYNSKDFPYYIVYVYNQKITKEISFLEFSIESLTCEGYGQKKYNYSFEEVGNDKNVTTKKTFNFSTPCSGFNVNVGCYYFMEKPKDIKLEFIKPNVNYSYNEEFITTFRIINNTNEDLIDLPVEVGWGYIDMLNSNSRKAAYSNDKYKFSYGNYTYGVVHSQNDYLYKFMGGKPTTFINETVTVNVSVPANSSNVFYAKQYYYIPPEWKQYASQFKQDILPYAKCVNLEQNIDAMTPIEKHLDDEDFQNISFRTDQDFTYDENPDLNGGVNFNYTEPSNNKEYNNVATWEEWEYDHDTQTFNKKTYTARLDFERIGLRPFNAEDREFKINNPSQKNENNVFESKSGYCIELSTIPRLSGDAAKKIKNAPSTLADFEDVYDGHAQQCEIYLPEDNFNKAYDLFMLYTYPGKTSEVKYNDCYGKYNGDLYIPFQPLASPATQLGMPSKTKPTYEFVFGSLFDEANSPLHLIPIWYPNNTDYKVQVKASGVWTPAGMLSYVGESNAIKINGSLFDDYKVHESSVY